MRQTEMVGDKDALGTPVASSRPLMQGLLDRFGIVSHDIERATVLVRDWPDERTTRTTIIVRRGDVAQNRNWFAWATGAGPVAIVGGEPWTELLHSFEAAADGLIDTLRLRERPGPICITGGSAASFASLVVAALIAEKLPGRTIKVVAFSLVTELYRKEPNGRDYYWPHMVGNLSEKPETMAGMRRYPLVRPFLARAMAAPGADLRVKAFTTPLSNTDAQQAARIGDLACVRLEEVLTDDYNHDMMAWIVMPAHDAALARAKLLQWMEVRNPNWPKRTMQTRVDREVAVAFAWRQKYPDLASIFADI
jgi:hypothetical protein